MKQIGVRIKKIHKLWFYTLKATINNNNNEDVEELWHRRMGHIHHGTLGLFREIVTGVPKISTEHDDVCRGCVLGNL